MIGIQHVVGQVLRKFGWFPGAILVSPPPLASDRELAEVQKANGGPPCGNGPPPGVWARRATAGDFKLVKISGLHNCSDMGTKPLPLKDLERYLAECGFVFVAGESSLALRATG